MKFLILFFIVGFVVVWAATRFRREINAMIIALRGSAGGQIGQNRNERSFEMVKCEQCGTWTPSENARLLNSGEKFCSAACIETAVMIKKESNRF